jgi:uncharacterized protein DUF6623
MSLITGRWVHGNLVQPEKPVDIAIRRGWGTHFGMRSSSENWFHFPITTLSTVHNTSVRLLKVCVFYRTDGTILTDINVYDGPIRIGVFENLNLTGDHSGEVDQQNCWLISPPVSLSHGIGISVGVEFRQDEGIGIAEILFTTAGAEFETP